jgi:hypothetical protein
MTVTRNQRLVLTLAALVAFALPLAPRLARVARAADEKVKKSELNDRMEDMDESFKKLKRTVRKADQNEESLKLINELQAKAVECKAMIPQKAAKVPEADRAKFVLAYRKEMAALIMDFCKMEQAILDGDNAKAVDIWKEANERQDKDHDQFMQKDEKKKKD